MLFWDVIMASIYRTILHENRTTKYDLRKMAGTWMQKSKLDKSLLHCEKRASKVLISLVGIDVKTLQSPAMLARK